MQHRDYAIHAINARNQTVLAKGASKMTGRWLITNSGRLHYGNLFLDAETRGVYFKGVAAFTQQ